MRACPICNTRFPAHIGQLDFERHIQAHVHWLQEKALDKVAEVSPVREEKVRLEGELHHLQEEKGKLERTVHLQRRQIEETRAAGKAKEEGMRACPVCNTRFPARIPQADFEHHVQGHFD